MDTNRTYICIDLKSFYASVECVERGLDPLTTNLVVADPERSEKTICLAVSPSMKALGVPNRCRVFQIPQGISYIMAQPRMKLYIDYSANIYAIYLKYIAKEDIHVYSVDEAFLDVTDYLILYQTTASSLAMQIMQDILVTTGITATGGIGSNLYLTKVALDITAKHVKSHIGMLDEKSYRETLWNHRPITDFWRVGAGTAKRLETIGIYTMEQIAHTDEDLLYHLFGIDAELLIDHSWGRESTTIADIKAYKPRNNSLSNGQVLPRDYHYEEGCLVVKEMADLLCLDLVEKELVTESISLYLGYTGLVDKDPAKGTISLSTATNSARVIITNVEKLYRKITDPYTPIRRINLSFNHVVDEICQQYDLFMNPADIERERNIQNAVLDIKRKFGKNAVLKGMNLQASGTTVERNKQIGGHKSGD